MRKHARNWMMKVLLGIIIFVFVLYFGSMGGRRRAEAIVTIDGKIISQAEFYREYQNLLDFYRQRFGGLLTEEMIRSMNLKEQVLNKMVYEVLLMKKAKDLKITVTDEELRKSITSFPAFQRNGVFDEALYQRMLKYNKMKPEEFEEMQRKSLISAKLEDLVLDGIHATEREIKEYYDSRNAKINLIKCLIPAADFTRNIEPTTTELEKFFKEHESDYRIPTRIQLSYILFSASRYLDRVQISKEEIGEYRSRLKEKAPEEKILGELKKSKAMQIAYTEAKKAHDEIYQMENFEAYAAKNNLPIKTTDFFDEKNPPAELKEVRDLLKVAFSLQVKEVSRVLTTGGGYIIVKLLAKKEAHTPPFNSVAQEVRKKYVLEEARKLALREAEAIIGRIKKGETLEKIARERKLAIGETGFFPVNSPPSSLGGSPEVISIILRLGPQKRLEEKPVPLESGYAIYLLKDWVPPSPEEFNAKKDTIRETFLQAKKAEAMRFWIEAMKTAMIKEGKLKYHKELKEL